MNSPDEVSQACIPPLIPPIGVPASPPASLPAIEARSAHDAGRRLGHVDACRLINREIARQAASASGRGNYTVYVLRELVRAISTLSE